MSPTIIALGRDPEAWLPDDLFRSLEQFERVLRSRCGVDLFKGPASLEAVHHLLDLLSAFKREIPEDPTMDLRPGCRTAVGLSDMAKKAEHVVTHPDFDQLCPHFALLLKDSRLLQNIRSPLSDAVSNKLFELLIAMSVMQFGRDVRLDDPDDAKGDNPDVISLIRGADWGFACKVPHTRQIKSYADNVVRAVEQIEVSPAEHGLVVIGLKNLFDHDRMWPLYRQEDGSNRYGAWPHYEVADAAIEAWVGKLLNGWEEAFGGTEGLDAVFKWRRATPVVLNYVHLTVLVERNGVPVLTSLRRIIPLDLGYREDPEAEAVIAALHDAVQRP
jgi:hypothetical protein